MVKRTIVFTFLLIISAFSCVVLFLPPKECGYYADFVRAGGHDMEDKKCICIGINTNVSGDFPVDGLSHRECHGIKIGDTF